LEQNLSAAQIQPASFSLTDREEIEKLALKARAGQTNWFQVEKQPLGTPREVQATTENIDGKLVNRLYWQTAYAADQPIVRYEIRRDDELIGQVDYQPQTTKTPFAFDDTLEASGRHIYQVVTVDGSGTSSASDPIEVVSA
ncbi:MAG: hypothetical protein JSU96_11430, partial [Acidobacteriota bacterium]